VVTEGMVLFALGSFLLLVAWKPRTTWKAFHAWKFRHPEANEPSDAAYGIRAVWSGVMGVLFIVGGIWALTLPSEDERERERYEEQQRVAEERRADCFAEQVAEAERALENGQAPVLGSCVNSPG
jgi:hypothetical protein